MASVVVAGCTGDSGGTGGRTATQTPTSTPTDSPTPTPTPTDSPTPRPDSDGDGVPDVEDDYPNDPDRQRDSDGDGVADSRDEYPDDPEREADSDGDGVADSFDDYPDNSEYSVLVDEFSETVDLNEDYYQYYELDVRETTDLFYEVEVQSDIRIDVFLTDGTNFRYFEDDADWEYYTDGSDFDTLSTSQSFRLGPDQTYYLVVDHTDEGGAAPPTNGVNDRITVDVAYTLAR